MTHTPGPWHWDSDPIKDDPLGRVRFRVVAKGRTITQCYYSSGDGAAEADTKLIAAAPLMLDALREIRSQMHNLPRSKTADLVEALADAAIAIARAQVEATDGEGVKTDG